MNAAKIASYCLGACALLTVTPSANAAGGTIVKLEGAAVVQRKGQDSPAAVASPVQAGDTIKVSDLGRLQLHLEDDSVFALAGGSVLSIDQFTMSRQDGGGAAVFSLLKGGLRTITGLIGKMRGDTYQVRTTAATIGVRGSAYSALLCDGACATKGRAREGLYVKAESGTIIVKNNGGELRLKAGKTAFAASINDAPVLVASSPLDNPDFASEIRIDVEFQIETHPPRIEPDPPASPS